MSYESFNDKEVSKIINDNFIAIKVDRQEHKDINNKYESICRNLTGCCGSPLTVIMAPNLMPFYIATYLPKNSIYDLPGLLDILTIVIYLWKTDKNKLKSTEEAIKYINKCYKNIDRFNLEELNRYEKESSEENYEEKLS